MEEDVKIMAKKHFLLMRGTVPGKDQRISLAYMGLYTYSNTYRDGIQAMAKYIENFKLVPKNDKFIQGAYDILVTEDGKKTTYHILFTKSSVLYYREGKTQGKTWEFKR